MSNYNVQSFNLKEFTPDIGGKLFPRPDGGENPRRMGPPYSGGVGESGRRAVIDQNFSTDREDKEESIDFETQFITERDIKTFLKNAEKQAAEMIEDAKGEVERIEREAFEKGFHEGKEDGLRESREEGIRKLLPSVEAFEKSLKEMAACRGVIYKNCEAELIELFNTLSRRVIHRELGRSNDFLMDVVREAMKEITQQEKIVVRLNPEDMEYGESFKRDLLAELGNVKYISMEKDDSISRGGCVIETNFGEIDSRVETKIREIEKAILEKKLKKEIYKTPDKLK